MVVGPNGRAVHHYARADGRAGVLERPLRRRVLRLGQSPVRRTDRLER